MRDWDEMAAFLADPATHGEAETQRIDTHTAAVVVVGERAWKLRRPVDYGWLDYATRARRRHCAEREIALNSGPAPGLYLGLGGVLRAGKGWRLVEPGGPIGDAEPVVVMRRFRQRDLFDRMAAAGRLTPELMRATGRAVADMHKAAPGRDGMGHLPAFTGRETNELEHLADLLGTEAVAAFSTEIQARAEACAGLAAQRGARRCHGDLHLRNIVLWQGRPAPFDCIDFNDAFTDIDPLYDLAFLLMDLDHRGHGGLAVEVFNAWAERMAGEPGAEVSTAYGGLALLPFFKACRAGIRAKVGALALRGRDLAECEAALAEARAYLALGLRYLTEAPPARLIAVGGLSGSGKSTLAWALAQARAGRLGAVVLRSDAIRKGLWGVEHAERLPREAYAAQVTERVYGAMLERAGMALAGGAAVILDAAHLKAEERDRAEALAAQAGVAFQGFWLDAPVEQMKARVTARAADASDADASVVEKQAGYDLGPIRWRRLVAEDRPEAVAELAMAALGG
ncbi:MAG: bifunctional aminoglycoside phosphotransferase/ATP-binding protein [Alphaproteobacteria bacterium]